jgi:hypothetical protein
MSISDQYGKCTASGYVVDESTDGEVRVSHRMPELTATDDGYDDRMSSDEMAAERHKMIDAYAATLEADGWIVERKGPHSRKPYLMVSLPSDPEVAQRAADRLNEGLDGLFRRLGPPDA